MSKKPATKAIFDLDTLKKNPLLYISDDTIRQVIRGSERQQPDEQRLLILFFFFLFFLFALFGSSGEDLDVWVRRLAATSLT